MLTLELHSHNGSLNIKNVLSIAYGKGSSKLVCLDHKPIKIFLPSGKLYVLHTVDRERIIVKFYHTEAVLTVKADGSVNFVAGRITDHVETQKYRFQPKLEDQEWKKLTQKRNEIFENQTWIDINNSSFKYF